MDTSNNSLPCVMIPQIETERLLMRPIDRGDFDRIYLSITDPKVYQWLIVDGSTVTSAQELHWVVQTIASYRIPRRSFAWAITEKGNPRIHRGSVVLHENVDNPHSFTLGYFLSRDAQGYGFMTEVVCAVRDWAFESDLNVQVLVIPYFEINQASAGVARKAGFTIRSRDPEKYQKYGKVWPGIITTLTREEWLLIDRPKP